MRISEPDPDNQPTRDEAQLAILRNDMGEAADEVVAAYQDTIVGELENLKASVNEPPTADEKRFAHTIKSSALAIGAMRLAHLAARLEKAINNEIPVELPAAVVEIEEELDRYLNG